MNNNSQIGLDSVNFSRDQDGRQAARVVAVSMSILFGLIFVLHAFSF